jgi:hypothetical protein
VEGYQYLTVKEMETWNELLRYPEQGIWVRERITCDVIGF